MKKSICALFVALSILLMMGCSASTKDTADVEIKNDSTEVSVDSENDNTEISTTESEKESVGENTDTSENSEEGDEEEPKQEPELSEEEKHAALMKKINQQQETCEMLNQSGTGMTYTCFYNERTNSFTYNMTVENGCDYMGFSTFDNFIKTMNSSSSMSHESYEIDCFANMLDGTIVLYSSLNGAKNADLTLVMLSQGDDEPTFGEQNALKSAQSYLSFSAFSHSRLIQQLEYEGYSNAEATYGADRCGANWCEQAAKCAANYLKVSAFSESGLREQLKFEGFTDTQAYYGAAKNGYGIMLDG